MDLDDLNSDELVAYADYLDAKAEDDFQQDEENYE